MSTVPSIVNPELVKAWINQAPINGVQKGLAHLIEKSEGPHGVSHTVFAQHLLMSWLPKFTVSRSNAERSELSLLEFVETALVYYSIPFTAKALFHPVIKKLMRDPELTPHLTKSVEELQNLLKNSPEKLAKILPAKAATVVASLLVGAVGWEYALTFAKNLMTAKVFKEDNFSDIVNLSEEKIEHHDNSPVVQKSRKRIKQALVFMAGALAASVALVTLGPKSKTLQNFSAKLLRGLDFNFKTTLKNGTEKLHFGLSSWQNRFFIAGAFIAYMDAVRDRLEFMEVFTRLAIVMSYLAFGSQWVERGAIKRYGKAFPQLIKKTMQKGKEQKNMKTIFEFPEEIIQRLQKSHPGKSIEELKTIAQQSFNEMLPSKLKTFWIPHLVGISIAGFANALFARLWTAYRFKHQKIGADARELFSLPEFLKSPGSLLQTGTTNKPSKDATTPKFSKPAAATTPAANPFQSPAAYGFSTFPWSSNQQQINEQLFSTGFYNKINARTFVLE